MVAQEATQRTWPEGVTCSVSPRATVRGKITEFKIHEAKDGTVSADLVLEETGGQQVSVLLKLPANARKERLTVAVERAAALPVIELTGTLLAQRAALVEAVKDTILEAGDPWPLYIMAQSIETDTDDIWDLGMPPAVPWTKEHTITLTLMVPDDHTLPESFDFTNASIRGESAHVPHSFIKGIVDTAGGTTQEPA